MTPQEFAKKHLAIGRETEIVMDGCYVTIGWEYEELTRAKKPWDTWLAVTTGSRKLYVEYARDVKLLHTQKVEKVESYRDFDKSSDSHVACIGYSPEQGGWIGWSHRGWNIFKPGYVVKEGDLCTMTGYIDSYAREHPERCFNLPVGFECRTMEDCRRCAIAYAMAVA